MPANTAEGWPYLLDEDHPLEYPAHSQAMANLLDQRWDTYESSGLFVPSAGFNTAGNVVQCTRSGGMVTLELILIPTANATLGQSFTSLGTIPAGFRPVSGRQVSAQLYTGSAWAANGIADVSPGGALGVRSVAATTINAATGAVYVTTTFRGA